MFRRPDEGLGLPDAGLAAMDSERLPQFPSFPNTTLERVLPAEGVVIEDPIEQLRTMDLVAEHLGEAGLAHMVAGWRGYKVVTRNVFEAMQQGRFDDPAKFGQTIPEFAGLAYLPIRRHLEGRRLEIAPQWRGPMYSERARLAGNGVQMWHFWRGHIPDLVKALLVTETDPQLHRADYFKIDDVLQESVPKVMAEIKILPSAMTQRGIQMVMNDVYRMRYWQWQRFTEMHAAGWTAERARPEVIPGDFRYERLRGLAQTIGNHAMRYANLPRHRTA